jgi:hypothetical protein
MFFAHGSRSTPSGAKVLEIDPGPTPFAGATHHLELSVDAEGEGYDSEATLTPRLRFDGKPRSFYDGGRRFPFENDAFDYVVASHVVKQVNPLSSSCKRSLLCARLTEVSKGYL